jgi:hypothetical protein
MNRLYKFTLSLAFLLIFALASHAQSYDISWYTIDGGGGTSTGGVYSVSGTIGQPDAGHLSGGSYTIDGGFWGMFAVVQVPGAPLLAIKPSAVNAILSWPATGQTFTLQQNPDLNQTNAWSAVGISVTTTNGTNYVTVPASAGNKFFRLKYP